MDYFGYGDEPFESSGHHAAYSSTSRSGLSRQRHFYTEPQLRILEAEFAREPFPSQERRRRISQHLQVSERSVLWWFQNRRRRLRQQGSSKPSQNHFVARRSRPATRSLPYSAPHRHSNYQNGGSNDWINDLDWPQCSPEIVQSVLSSIQTLPVLTSLDLDLISNDGGSDGFPSPTTESPVATPSAECWPHFPPQFASPVTTPATDHWPGGSADQSNYAYLEPEQHRESTCNLDVQNCERYQQVDTHYSISKASDSTPAHLANAEYRQARDQAAFRSTYDCSSTLTSPTIPGCFFNYFTDATINSSRYDHFSSPAYYSSSSNYYETY